MGVINLEYVISCSSQDPVYKVENLLHNPGSEKPWLCSIQNESDYLEAEFQLNRASRIDFIDIGNFGSSTVEVQVGLSSFPSGTNYVSLLPPVTLLSPADLKERVDRCAVYMFNKSNMIKGVADEKWDRIRVICSQPHKKIRQFGLSFLSLRTKESHSQLNIDDQPLFTEKKERHFSRYLAGRREEASDKSERAKVPPPTCPPFANYLLSRGRQIYSKSKSSAIQKKRTAASMAAFKEVVNIFFIACTGEDLENKTSEEYINEFEEQCQEKLNSSERFVFDSIYKAALKKKRLEEGFEENESTMNQSEINNNDNLAPATLSASGFSFSSGVIYGSPPHQSEIVNKAEYELCSSDFSTSDIQDFDMAVPGPSKRSRQDVTSVEESKRSKHLKVSEKSSSQPKTCFSRPEDFIQFDGTQPSTSSGIVLIDCPICGEPYSKSEIERHAATCGEIAESPEYSCNETAEFQNASPDIFQVPGANGFQEMYTNEFRDLNANEFHVPNRYQNSSGNEFPEVIHLGPVDKLANCPLCGDLYPESKMHRHIEECVEND